MVFNQKPRKPIIFTAKSSKNTEGYCQPKKESTFYNLPFYTHNKDHFHRPRKLKFASGIQTKRNLNNDKHNEFYQKKPKNYYKDNMFNPK